jgi:hypothetical protein
MHFGLLSVLAAGGLTACHADDSTAASDDLGRIAATETSADCVDLDGNKHCALGKATLATMANGGVQINGMATAGNDGVAIMLPDVTQFSATGQADSKSSGTTLLARSINEGVSTSSMTLQRLASSDSYAISASFTGSGAGSTYTAVFYDNGKQVGTIGGLPSGQPAAMVPPRGCRPFPCITIRPIPIPPWPPFLVVQNPLDGSGGSTGPGAPGACVWKINFGQDNLIAPKLADGTTVLADEVDLVEDVKGQGSYPYLTFNRIDYTSDASDGQITAEIIK